eukprot:c5850_g1_i1.p1 GENE.c5850_g1_i1~~c5850_g1_i1.p1  ORF type:complete len:603 (+),score=131.18 c5850_g1_i1:1301-3109(+)
MLHRFRYKSSVCALRLASITAKTGQVFDAIASARACARLVPLEEEKVPPPFTCAIITIVGHVTFGLATQIHQPKPQDENSRIARALNKLVGAFEPFLPESSPSLMTLIHLPTTTDKEQLLEQSIHKYLLALSANPSSRDTMRHMGSAQNELASCLLARQRFTKAWEHWCAAIKSFERCEDGLNTALVYCSASHGMRVRARWENSSMVLKQQGTVSPDFANEFFSAPSFLPPIDEIASFKHAFSFLEKAVVVLDNSRNIPETNNVPEIKDKKSLKRGVVNLRQRASKDLADTHYQFAFRLLRTCVEFWNESRLALVPPIMAVNDVVKEVRYVGGEREATIHAHLRRALELYTEIDSRISQPSHAAVLCFHGLLLLSLEFFSKTSPVPSPTSEENFRIRSRKAFVYPTDESPQRKWEWHRFNVAAVAERAIRHCSNIPELSIDLLRIQLAKSCCLTAMANVCIGQENPNTWPQSQQSVDLRMFSIQTLTDALTQLLESVGGVTSEKFESGVNVISRTESALGGAPVVTEIELSGAILKCTTGILHKLIKVLTLGTKGVGCISNAVPENRLQAIKSLYLSTLRKPAGDSNLTHLRRIAVSWKSLG